MPWMLGMIPQTVPVDAVTRATSSRDAFARTSAHFQVLAGTVTCPLETVLVTPPLLPVPPVPAGPETMYSSSAGRSERRKLSRAAHGPWLLSGACATMFDIRNVAWLMGV